MQEDNIVEVIPLTDISEFTLSILPSKDWLNIIYSEGFDLTEIYINDYKKYYTFTKKAGAGSSPE